MNILITGGSGFLGKHFLKRLRNSDYNLLEISRSATPAQKNLISINASIDHLDSYKTEIIKFDPDVVVHLAWGGIPDFSAANCKLNLFSSIEFFNFLFKNTNCKKFLTTGSCFEYGKKIGACKETDSLHINSYFSWAKDSLRNYLSVKCAEYNVSFCWFRIFYVYGPGQRKDSLIPTLIKSLIKKKVPIINTPLNKNDFVYVKDIVEIIIHSFDKNTPSGIYNLGSGKAVSVYDITCIVEKLLWGNSKISHQLLSENKNVEDVNFWADTDKTMKVFNLNCNTSLETGINNHIDFIRSSVLNR